MVYASGCRVIARRPRNGHPKPLVPCRRGAVQNDDRGSHWTKCRCQIGYETIEKPRTPRKECNESRGAAREAGCGREQEGVSVEGK